MTAKLYNLQGLRGIACLLVLGIHLGACESHFGIAREFLRPFRWFGFAGVDLFFVISGFIITHTQADSLGRPRAIPGYLFRRFWRVYPLFWLIMLFAVPLVGAALNFHEDPQWLPWLTLTPDASHNTYVGTAWTLVYEIVFYAAFALLFVLPRRVAPFALVAWAIVIATEYNWTSATPFHSATFAEVLLSPLILEFLSGCAIAAILKRFRPRFGRSMILAGVIWGIYWGVEFAVPGQPYGLCSLMFERLVTFGIASAFIVYGCIAAEREGTLKLPRWLQSTGDASYSIYLWHGPILMALHFNLLDWPHHTTPHLAWLAFMLLATWGGGMLVHRWVERPLLHLVKRRSKEPDALIYEARVSLHREGPFDELLVGGLGLRANHVDLEGPADAIAADVLQPLVDDELIFAGYPELGSRPNLDSRLSRVHGDDH